MSKVWNSSLLILITLAILLSAGTAQAQPLKPWKSWFGHIALGYAVPTSEAGDVLDDGWNLTGGATYKPEDWPVGLLLEASYSQFDVQNSVLKQLGVGGGDAEFWTVTAGGIWSTKSEGTVNLFLDANIGVYRRNARLTDPGVGFVPGGCTWFGCWPGGFVPVDVIVDDYSDTNVGGNVGIGLSFSLASDSQIYVEVKYHYADTDPVETKWVPIMVGYKW